MHYSPENRQRSPTPAGVITQASAGRTHHIRPAANSAVVGVRHAPVGIQTLMRTEDDTAESSVKKPAAEKKNEPCTRTILAEGTCEFLAKNSAWVCCDPVNGVKIESKTSKAEPGKKCPSKKWTSIFTCDKTCAKAVEKGCDDTDNWMAIPGNKFSSGKCGDIYTVCANGKQTSGYVRDKSVTDSSYEVSPGIQSKLGVKAGASFKGAIYAPDAAQTTIDKDKCCKGGK